MSSSYSEYLKTKERKDLEFFFGEDLKMISGKYFLFKRYIDEDHIIVLTNNIKILKEKTCLIVSGNKVVWLPDWAVRKVASYQEGINTYAVKLTRKYYKPYEMSFSFDEYLEMEEMSFDEWVTVAKAQAKENLKVRQGWCK